MFDIKRTAGGTFCYNVSHATPFDVTVSHKSE